MKTWQFATLLAAIWSNGPKSKLKTFMVVLNSAIGIIALIFDK